MTVGRWMSLDVAFSRAAKIEGAPGAAYRTFMAALTSRRIKAKACRKEASDWGLEDDRFSEINADDKFWCEVHLCYQNGKITAAQADPLLEDDEFILGDGSLFEICDWDLFVDTASFDEYYIFDLPVQPGSGSKKSGGRPQKHDWVRAAAVAASYVAENDYPKTQAALAEVMRASFAHAGSYPDKRDIERFVAEMYKEKDRLAGQRGAGTTKFPRIIP